MMPFARICGLVLFIALAGCALQDPAPGNLPPVIEAAPGGNAAAESGGDRTAGRSADRGAGAVVHRPQSEAALATPQPLAEPVIGGEPPSRAEAPAVVALLEQATQQAGRGQADQAAATLERALRIDPRHAGLWHRLAAMRLSQRRYREAIDLASRSNALAGGDARLLAGNGAVIERACAAIGEVADDRCGPDR